MLICAQIFNAVDLKYADANAMPGSIQGENGIACFDEIHYFFSGKCFWRKKGAMEYVSFISREGVCNYFVIVEVETFNVVVCHKSVSLRPIIAQMF